MRYGDLRYSAACSDSDDERGEAQLGKEIKSEGDKEKEKEVEVEREEERLLRVL